MKYRPVFWVAILASWLPFAGCFQPYRRSPANLYLQGELQAERGEFDAAMDSLSKAIEKNPQMGLAYVARGQIFKEKGDYQKAAGDFKKASTLEPYNFNAHYQLGLMYQYLRRFEEAIVAYQRAVEIRPLDPDANMNLAMAYTAMGQPLKGLSYAQRAVQGSGDTDSATAYANLGTLYATLGNDDAAIEALKHSIELNSRQPEIYLNLGQEYIKTNRYQQARNVFVTAQQIAPSPAISERLGLAYYKLHDLVKARDAFNDALRQAGNSYPQALNGLGVVAMTQSLATTPPDLDSAREALDYWNRSLKIDPKQAAIQQLVNKYTGAK